MKNFIVLFILVSFIVTGQIGLCPVYAQDFVLPAPGQMVALSPSFSPAVLKGIKLDPKNPFSFHFFVDRGDDSLSQAELSQESSKLIKYFLASLTIPEQDLWVNLSPYEKNRIVPQEFGQTEMGRDLLAEDYLLKQITASLIYPESQLGKAFWNTVYAQAQAKYGSTNIPINTFNKVWIVPDKAVVYENSGTAFVLENHLKVMLEQDYLSLHKHQSQPGDMGNNLSTNVLGSQIVREIVIPALTREVNEGKNFSQLRQVFYSLILATWYKKKIKDSILNKIYSDRNKIHGLQPLNVKAPQGNHLNDVEYIYQQYLRAFKKGVFNYIQEEPDQMTGQTIPRKYFSGGVEGSVIPKIILYEGQINPAQLVTLDHAQITEVVTDLAMTNQTLKPSADAAMKADISETSLIRTLRKFEAQGSISRGTRMAFEKAAAHVDKRLLNKIKIRTENSFEHWVFSSLKQSYRATAINSRFSKKLILLNRNQKTMSLSVLLHEFGHVIDFLTKFEKRWFSDYFIEHGSLMKMYFIAVHPGEKIEGTTIYYFSSSPSEMLAQMFADYTAASRLVPEEILEADEIGQDAPNRKRLLKIEVERQKDILRYFNGPLIVLRNEFEKILSGSDYGVLKTQVPGNDNRGKFFDPGNFPSAARMPDAADIEKWRKALELAQEMESAFYKFITTQKEKNVKHIDGFQKMFPHANFYYLYSVFMQQNKLTVNGYQLIRRRLNVYDTRLSALLNVRSKARLLKWAERLKDKTLAGKQSGMDIPLNPTAEFIKQGLNEGFIDDLRTFKTSFDDDQRQLEAILDYFVKQSADGAMMVHEQRKGGIDLNPAQMSLQIEKGVGVNVLDSRFRGNDMDFNIDPAQITGVTFTIRRMTPVVDLPMELGLTNPTKQEALAKA